METLKFPLEPLTNRGLTVIFGNRYLPNLPGTTNCPYQLPVLKDLRKYDDVFPLALTFKVLKHFINRHN